MDGLPFARAHPHETSQLAMSGKLLKDVVIEALVGDVQWRSDDGRFTVAHMKRDGHDEPFVAVGDLGAVAVGETLRLHGRWSQHAVHGERFRVNTFVPVIPTTTFGIERYLGSGMIPGIGRSMAKRLVEQFGGETLDIIATQSGRLRDVKGIGKKRAGAIAEAVRERRDEAESMSFLHGLGLGPATARRILKKYGSDAARQLRDDPYLVAEQVVGVGFRTADRIGEAIGIPADDPRRAAGAALHVLARAADSGHVYLPRQVLIDETGALQVPGERVDQAIDTLEGRGLVILDGEDVYAPPLHRAERQVAARLLELSRPRSNPRGLEEVALKAVEGLSLSATQTRAVHASMKEGLLVLTGGPGTGKTTTVRAIVAAQRALERRIVLCAPTGRAAKRLTEATGAEASTIHRLLEWNPASGSFKRNRDEPLEAEVILVDEASMLNIQLAQALCDAVAPSSRLVLVGDVDQLPPVGPGQVLRDVIQSEAVAVVRLDEVFRQAQRSAIVRGAHAILRGDPPKSTPTGEVGDGDLFIVRARSPEQVHRQLPAVLDRMSARYGFDPRTDVQVLVPMRRGSLGTETLNELLQASLNANADRKNPGKLAVGDKVMQLRNDYEKEVFNGDLGEVRRVQGGVTYVMIDGREIRYTVDQLDQLTLAYASTIHKVQGSEFPAVVIVLHGAHHVLLSRALLYTAVTRAKRLVVLLGDPAAIARAARNALVHDTYARLASRLRCSLGV